jgi:hypothetical protein
MVHTRLTDYSQQTQQESLLEQVEDNLTANKKVKILQSNVCSLSEIKANLLYQVAQTQDINVLYISEIGAQWFYVAVTQGPERRFEFSEG